MAVPKTNTDILTGNEAMAVGAKLCRVQVVAAYPITPQSQVTENLSQFVESGKLKAQYITVESEHSALSVCIGASTVGARAFTATSANGLAYMCELIHWAAGARLPIVMGCVNRAMAAPWSVLNDQQDSMSQRDAGWIQIYARNNQEIIDTLIQAYRIAEQLYVPVMVCYDGYILSHTVMPVNVPSQKDVDKFLPAYVPHTILKTADPRNINQVTLADPRNDATGVLCHGYMELRYLLAEAFQKAPDVIRRVDEEYGKTFRRCWGGMTWAYRDEDAEVLLTAAGSIASEATVAVDALRAQGVKAGVRAVRVYRPFPAKELAEHMNRAKLVCVFDKSLSYGYQGPICADVKAALYASAERPAVHGFVAGLGGRDVKARELVEAVKQSVADYDRGVTDKETGWINCQI